MKLFLLLLFFALSASAGTINYNDLEFNRKFQFGGQEINQDDVVDFNPTSLSADFGVGAQCGQISIDGSIRSAISRFKDLIKNDAIIRQLAAASPMLLACKFNPALCEAVNNLKASFNWAAKFNLDQCAIIDKYTSGVAKEYNQKISDCIGKQKAKGLNPFEAHDKCVTTFSDKLASITGDNKYVGTVNVVEDSFKWMGVTDEKTKQDTVELVGETSINHGVIKESYGKGGRPQTPLFKEKLIVSELNTKICQILGTDSVIKKKGLNSFLDKNGYRGRFHAYFNYQTLDSLTVIPSPTNTALCQKVIRFIAKKEVTEQTQKAHSILSQSLTNPNLTDMTRHFLEQKAKKLEAYLQFEKHYTELDAQTLSQEIVNAKEYYIKNMTSKQRRDYQYEQDKKRVQKILTDKCQNSVRC